MTKSITRRMLVAGALVGSVLGSLVSTQAADTFAVVTTSVESGFASVNPIAVRFTTGVNLAASSGTLVDRNGKVITTVLGRTSSGSGPDHDSLVLTPNYGELEELRSPYTLTLNAVQAVLPGAVAETELVTREIWLDLKKGSAAITSPTDSGQPRVVAPGETLKVAGYAYDDYAYDTVAGKLIPRVGNRSGLASVEIKLYKLNPGVRSMGGVKPGTPPTVGSLDPLDVRPGTPPSVSPPVIQPSQEVTSLKHSATLSEPTRTTGAIEGEKTWTANVAGIGQGSWTLQAVAIDVAGNRSAAVETSFIIL